MAYTFPLGPYHPALKEPFKVNVRLNGEIIESASIEVGFSFRGIEALAQSRNWIEVVTLIERVCGICSNVHTSTFCMAAEAIAGIQIPPCAVYIRTDHGGTGAAAFAPALGRHRRRGHRLPRAVHGSVHPA